MRNSMIRRIAIFIIFLVTLPIIYKMIATPHLIKSFESRSYHEAIVIIGDENFTSANGVVGGNGTPENPYVISNWTFSGDDVSITIMDTNAHFVIKNCTIANSTTGIRLQNVRNGSVDNLRIENTQYPITSFYSNISFSDCSVSNYTEIKFGNSICTIENSEFSSGFVLYVQDDSAVVIMNSTFFDCGNTIYTLNKVEVYIENSSFFQCDKGIMPNDFANVKIERSTFEYCDTAIYATKSVIFCNETEFKNNGMGINIINAKLGFFSNNTFVNNSILPEGKSFLNLTVENSTVNGRKIFVFKNGDYEITGDAGEVITYNATARMQNGSAAGGDVFVVCEKSRIYIENYSILLEGTAIIANASDIILRNSTVCSCKKIGNIENSYVFFANSLFENNYKRLYIKTSSGTILNSSFRDNNDTAIWLEWNTYMTIKNNYLSNNSVGGIMINFCRNCTIINNTFQGCGVYLHGGENALWSYTTNNFVNNTINGKKLLFYLNQSDVTVGDAGEVIAVKCKNLTFYGGNYSLSDVGVQVLFSQNIMFINCTASWNRWHGLYVCFSQNITFLNCTSTENRWAGLYLYRDDNVSVMNCSQTLNHIGILIYSSDVYIKNSEISRNFMGVEMDSSFNSTITENIFKLNEDYAIKLDGCTNSTIYLNYFYGNGGSGLNFSAENVQAYDNSQNLWNSTEFGNYWADWANNNDTNDANGDGIVDYPYPIEGGSKDYIPLKDSPVVFEIKFACAVTQLSLYTLLLIISPWKSPTRNLSHYLKKKRRNFQKEEKFLKTLEKRN